MDYKDCKTYEARIYVGLRIGYSKKIHTLNIAYKICQDYCNKIGFCVTFTETQFIYKSGKEPGLIIGIINYPRFPKEEYKLNEHALTIAGLLLNKLEQNRISIVFKNKTIMIQNDNLENM